MDYSTLHDTRALLMEVTQCRPSLIVRAKRGRASTGGAKGLLGLLRQPVFVSTSGQGIVRYGLHGGKSLSK
jgi:hypothetical protein